MPTQNTEQKPMTLEDMFLHKASSITTDNEGNVIKTINVMDELLGNKKPIEEIYSNVGDNTNFEFTSPGYYIEKYSKETNPLDKEALPANQILSLFNKAYTANNMLMKLNDTGVDINAIKFEMNKGRNGLDVTDGYMGNFNDSKTTWKGWYNPDTNTNMGMGTAEEIAAYNPSIMKDGQLLSNPGKDGLDELYGDGKAVITTIKDPQTGRSMFQVLPADSFVAANKQYSTKWGPQESYGNAFYDFARSFYGAAGAGSIKSISSIGSLINDTFNHDENYKFSQGGQFVNDHIQKAVEQSLQFGNIEQAEKLREAQESGDIKAINEALNFAYSSMPSNIGQELRYEAQPLNYGKFDKELQSFFNQWNEADFKQSVSTETGAGMGNWMARQGPTLGFLFPQIAIGVLSGGASVGASTLTSGLLKSSITNLVKYVTPLAVNAIGTSQAFSSFERTAQENGVSPETIAKFGWYALPLTYATEHVTNKWIGQQMMPNLWGKATREVFEPMAKKMATQEAAGTLTDKGIKDAVVGGYKKIFNSKFIKSIKESDGYWANMGRANISEFFQENTEQALYNLVQMEIDKAAPYYAEVGNGKFGTTGMFENFVDTSLGTVFATTIMTAITGIAPKIIRKRTGQPEPSSRQKAQEMLKWDVLRNGGENVIAQATEEIKKDVSVFGNKKIKAKDSFIDGTYNPDMMTVPESPTLQAMGYKVGQVIDNFAEMQYVELIEQVDAYKELNAKIGLNDLDRQILSSAGFDEEISLNKSADAYVNMQQAKKEYEAIIDEQPDTNLSPEEQQKVIDKNIENKKPALDKYNAALKQYQYYTATQPGTKNSEAVNDMVKRNTTYMKQVEMAMTELNENKQITKEQKNDPNFQGRYLEAWNKVIKDEYTYQKLQALKDEVDVLSKIEIEAQQSKINDIENRTTAKTFNDEIEALNKRTEALNTAKTYNENDHTTLVRDIAGLSNRLAKELTLFGNYGTTMNNTELEGLASKYKSMYDAATGVTTRINENDVNKTNAPTMKEITSLTKKQATLQSENEILLQQIEQQNEVLNNATEETLADENAKFDALNESLRINQESLNTINDAIEGKSEGLKDLDPNTHDKQINDAAELLGQKDNAYSRTEKGQLPKYAYDDEQNVRQVVENKNETQEQFDKRIEQLRKDNTPNGKTYLFNYFQQMKDDMEEAMVWIESVLKDQGKTYKETYPEVAVEGKKQGQYYGQNGDALIRANVKRIQDNYKNFSNTFKTANAIQNDARIQNHQTPEEKAFIQEIGIVDEKGLNPYQKVLQEANSMTSDVLSKIDPASVANKKERLHTRVIIHENTQKSVSLLSVLGLKKADGSLIIPTELSAELSKLGDLPQDIIDAHGQLDDDQIVLLAKRETVVNNILSTLTIEYNKNPEAFMSEGNKKLLFEIFDAFYEKHGADITKPIDNAGTNGTIMWLDDANSHIGKTGSKTNETRQNHATTPLFKLENNKRVYNWTTNNKSDATRLREHLNVIMWIGSKYTMNDIFNERKYIFNNEQDLGLETGEQEAAGNTIISLLSNKSEYSPLQVFKERYAKLHSGEIQNIPNWLSNAITVGGDYGTGKTQFVVKRALKILQKLDSRTNNKSLGKLTVVSITEQLQAVHSTAFGAFNPTIKKYSDFITKINEFPVEDGNTYIIDEASIISSSGDKIRKSELLKIEEHFAGKGAKVIFLGDVFQMRDASSVGNYPISMFHTMTTHMLTEQFSATSPLLRTMAEEARKVINVGIGSGAVIQFPNVTERIEGNTKDGAKYYSNQLEVWSDFVNSKNTNRAIIFIDKAELDNFLKNNKSLEKQYQDNKDRVFFAVRRETDPSDLKLLQGLRQEEVYITYNQYEYSRLQNPINQSLMASALYTAIGRAGGIHEWVGMIGDVTKNVAPNLAESIKLPTEQMNIIQKVQSDEFRRIEDLRFKTLDTESNKTPSVETPIEKPTGQPEANKNKPGEKVFKGVENGIITTTGKVNVSWIINIQHSGKTIYKLIFDGNETTMEITNKEINLINDNKELNDAQKIEQKRSLFRGRMADAINEFNGQEEVEVPKKKKRASKTKKNKVPTIITTTPLALYIHKGITLLVNNSYTQNGKQFQITSINQHEWSNNDVTRTINAIDTDGNVYTNQDLKAFDLKQIAYVESEEVIPEGIRVANTSKERFENNSTTMFKGNVINEQSVFWGTSATLVGFSNSMSPDNMKIRRSINDAIMSQFSYLQDNGFALEVSYEENNVVNRDGREEPMKMAVIRIKGMEVSSKHIEALRHVLESSYAWNTKVKAIFEKNISPIDKFNKLFSIAGLNNGKMTTAVGSMSLPSTATIGTDGNLIYSSFEVRTNESLEQRKTDLINKWDETINGNFTEPIKAILREQKEMNLALFDMHAGLTTSPVLNYYEGIRKVLYTKDETSVTTIQKFLSDNPGAIISSTPLYVKTSGNTQLRLKVQLGQEELSLVVRMPRFSDINNGSSEISQRALEAFNDIKDKMSNDKLVGDKVSDWKQLQKNFKETTAYKLLRSNMSLLIGLPANHDLKKYVSIDGTEFIDIKPNPGLKENEKGANIQAKYQQIVSILSDQEKLIETGFFDYLTIENGAYGTHVGKPIVDVLNIQAIGMNNKSFYLGLPKTEIIAPEIVNNETSSNDGSRFNTSSLDLEALFEETKYSSPDVTSIDDAVKRVSSRLGDTFVSSEYFTIKDGKIVLNDGRTASGQVIRNAFMTLSQENNTIKKSTPDHEVFHIVYRNFVSPEMKVKLQSAVRTISNVEKGPAINSQLDAEEWMARDYAKQNRVSDTGNKLLDFAINTWNNFKDFMKALVSEAMPLYRANKVLKDVYSDINAGKFVDRVSEIKPDNSETAYDEDMESASEEISEQSVNERSEHRLQIASTIESKLISELKNKASLIRAKNVIKMTIMQDSLYSNTKRENILSFNDSVNKLVQDAIEIQKEFGDNIINILVQDADGNINPKGVPITVREYVENSMTNSLADGYTFNTVDQYRIYTDENVRMLVQVMLPSYDMKLDTYDHETGAGERFNWDGYSSEQNISAIQKLYLSTIPRIDANGKPIVGKAPFLDQKEVHSILIDLGMKISEMRNNEIGKVEQLQMLLLNRIDKGQIVKVKHGTKEVNEYLDEGVEKYHSIYNYLFEARGKKGLKQFELDYTGTYFTGNGFKGKFKGLLERTVENEMDWRKRNSNQEVSLEQEYEQDLINKARLHLFNLVSTYTSMNIKNQLVATYYEDTMKFTHLSKELWRVSAEKLKTIQKYDISEGVLKTSKINFIEENVQFNDDNISVTQKKNQKIKTPFLNYEDGKFKFVNNNGITHRTKKVGPNIVNSLTLESLELNGEFKHVVDQFIRVKNLFGLKEISPAMFKSMLMATSWDQVTDIIRTTNSLGYVSNYNKEMSDNYLTPADFLADYIGTMLTMYSQYGKTWKNSKIENINGINQTTIEDLNITNYLQYHTDDALSHRQRIESIPEINTKIILDYLSRTTPKSLINFEVKPDIIDGVEIPLDPKKVRYISPEDMWTSTNMISSMIQKVQNRTNDTKKFNAEGKPTYSVALSTTLNDELNSYKFPDNDEVKINAFVEFIGEKRSLGFTSIGKTKIDTADFIDNSINLFMQEMIKEQNKPILYVPTTTVADTGKIIYAQVESNLISVKNGFKIDYNIAAREILREYDKKQALVNNSRQSLQSILVGLQKSSKVIKLEPAENGSKYYNDGLQDTLKALSLEAHKNGTFVQLKKLFDNTNLTKSDNLENKDGKDFFDIVYKTDEKTRLQIIQPGYNITNDLPQYDYDYNKSFPGLKDTSYIERIRQLSTDKSDGSYDKLESAIKRVFQQDYEAFTDMIKAHGFNPVDSFNNLTENTLGHSIKNPKNLTKYDNPYYQYIPKTKDAAAELRYNQPMFGYYLATMFANNRLDDFSLNPYSMKDIFDKSKRNGPIHTPASGLLFNEKITIKQNGQELQVMAGTLPSISNGIFYRDNKVNGGKTWQTVMVDGKPTKMLTDADNMIEPENGQANINPLYYQMMLNSIGGTNTVIGTASMFKGLLAFKRADGSYSEFKRGDKVLTGFDMQNTYYKNMFMRMLAETDFNLIDAVGQEVFDTEQLSFTNKFIELYDAENSSKDFDKIVKDMMSWIYNKQFYENNDVNENGVVLADTMYKSIVSFMAPISTQKGAVTKVNDYYALDDVISTDIVNEYNSGNRLNSDYIDNTKTKIVMNASQDTDVNNKLQSAPTQQDATGFGVTNDLAVSKLYSDYIENKQKLQTELRKNLEDAISNMPLPEGAIPFKKIEWANYPTTGLTQEQMDEIDPAIKQFQKFIRSRVVNSLRTSGQDLAFIELFNEETVSLQLPMMRTKVIQAYRNLTNQSVQGRVKGLRVTQTAGEYVNEYVKDGLVYSKDDVLMELYDNGKHDLSFDDYYSPEIEQYIIDAGFIKQKLQDMDIIDGNTTVGHIVMPNIYAKIYGHRSNESMVDIQSIRVDNERILISGTDLKASLLEAIPTMEDANYERSLWETVIDSPMVRKAIKNIQLEKYVDDILSVEVDENGHRVISKRFSNLLQSNTTLKEKQEQLLMAQTNESILDTIDAMDLELTDITDKDKVIAALMSNEQLLDMVLTETQLLLDTFNKSNESFLSRVPATFLGSGGVFKTVMFHNGGNVVYIPTGMTLRNDSDYDIDALTLYANSIDKKGHLINQGADGARNEMNRLRNEITLHKANQESLFLTSSLKKIDEVTDKKQKRSNKEIFYNNSVRSLYESYSRNKAGADAIGILANTLTVSSTIASSYSKGFIETGTNSGIASFLKKITNDKKLPYTGLDSFVIELGTWQQGALDNVKNNTFANFGLSALGINILGVLKLQNKTNEEVYDFFNNYEIKQLFKAYEGKTSIMTKSSDFNLTKLSEERIRTIETDLNYFITNNQTNLSKYLESKDIKWETSIKDRTKYAEEMIQVDTMLQQDIDTKLITLLKAYQGTRAFYDEYNFNGTSDEQIENLVQWKYKNGFNDYKLFSFKNIGNIFSDGNTLFDKKELSGITKEQRSELELMIKARANINISKSKLEGLKYLSSIPSLSVTADALYRVSTIMGLRKGLPTQDREFNNLVNNIEQYIGMSLKDYMAYNNESINIDKHKTFYMANNDVYNKMADSTAAKPTDKQFLLDQEVLVANEINIAKFIKNNPQLDFIIKDLYRQKLMMQQIFIQDNAIVEQEITKGFLKLQNRTNVIFGGEVSTVNTAINDAILDKYYNSIGEQSVTSSLYIQKTTSNTFQNPANLDGKYLDLKSLFDRQSFVNGFPQFMIDIQENIDNVQYLQQTLKDSIPDSDLMKLQNNGLIKLLTVGGEYQGKLRLDVNMKEMSEPRVAFLHDEFKKLPGEYQTMLTNYELIVNRMGYTNGSLMQVIGVDFYKDIISTVYNDTSKELRGSLGMDAFIADRHRNNGVTFDNTLKKRMYDNLGLKPEFSQRWNGDAVKSNSPHYVYDNEIKIDEFGKKYKTGRINHYKLNEQTNEYEKYENITSLGISSDPDVELTTELKVFSPSVEEEYYINQALEHKSTDPITHVASVAWVNQKDNKYIYTRNGILVILGKINGTNFNYRVALDSDMNKREEARRAYNLIKNNRMELVRNTLQYDMLSPDSTTINGKPFVIKVRGDKFLPKLKLNTITNEGKNISISLFDTKGSYTSMQDVLDTFRTRLLQSVGETAKYLKTELNQFTGNTEEEQRISRKKYIAKSIYGLLETTRKVDENGQPTVEAIQAQVARMYIVGRETLLLKHLVNLRIDEYLKNGKLEDITSTNFIRNEDTKFNNDIEKVKIGKSDYGTVVRTAIINRVNPNANVEMRKKEQERSELLNTLEGSLSLWNQETKQTQLNEDIMKERFYEGDIKPDANTVFVFGSNPIGVNGNVAKGTGGAALVAQIQFGVQQGEIMDNRLSQSGNAYGLTTVTGPGKKLSMSKESITNGIKKLYETAKQNPDKKFKVAYRNINEISLNGYNGLQMIDMFNAAGVIPQNVIFSKEWGNTGKLNITNEIGEKITEVPEVNNEALKNCK
jgi:hypothetical protein